MSRARRFGFLGTRARALLLLLVLGSGAAAATALSALDDGRAIALSLVADFAVFRIGSRLLTACDVAWRKLAWGAAAASIAWEMLQSGGALYVRYVLTIASNTDGTFAVVIGPLSFIYLSVMVAIVVTEANVVAAQNLWPAQSKRAHGQRHAGAVKARRNRIAGFSQRVGGAPTRRLAIAKERSLGR